MAAHLSERCLLLLAGMCDEAARQDLEATLLSRVCWPSVAPHTRLSHLTKYFSRIDMMLIATRFCRKGTKELARAARQRGIRVVWLPGGLNAIAIQMKLQGCRDDGGGQRYG